MYTEIKTFEDACKAINVEPTIIPDFSFFPEADREAMIAHAKLVIIAKAINGDWVPDWNDWDQYKYYPWFEMGSPSGGGFSCDGYGTRGTRVRMSARAFAFKLEIWQSMPESSLKTCTKAIL